MGWYRDFEIEAVRSAPADPHPCGDTKNLLLGLPIYGVVVNGIMEETAMT